MCARLRWLSPLALLALGAAPAPSGPPGFQVVTVGVPGKPQRLQAGDLDADGDVDLMVFGVGHTTIPLLVLRQDAGGSFVPGWTASLGTGPVSDPADLDLGDLDLDGDLDALANIPYAVSQSRLNGGHASFEAFKPVATSSPRIQNTLGLLDADAVPDIAAFDVDLFGYVGGHKGLGNGSFLEQNFLAVGGQDFGTRAELGDVTGDGLKDLVRVSTAGLQYTRGAPGAAFPGWGPNVTVASGAMEDLALADLNGDGRLDVVTSLGPSNAIEVFTGQGGGLVGPNPFPGGVAPDQLAVADMNADGFLDVVLASKTMATVTVNSGTGDAVFLDVSTYRGGRGATDLLAADLDADGDTDLAETVPDGRVLLLFNKLVP